MPTKISELPNTQVISALSGSINVTKTNIVLGNGKAMQTGTTNSDTALIQAYDVNDTTYRTFATLTAGNTPSLAISQPAGGTLSYDGGTIGGATPAAGTFTTLTANTQLIAQGITDGSTSPAAGKIGQVVSSTVASGSAVALTTGTVADVTNISLTAGNWLVSGHVVYTVTSSTPTVTNETVFLGTASGNNTTGRDTAVNTGRSSSGATATSDDSVDMPTHYLQVSGTTTYYLKASSTFTGGNISAFGYIIAVRIS